MLKLWLRKYKEQRNFGIGLKKEILWAKECIICLLCSS